MKSSVLNKVLIGVVVIGLIAGHLSTLTAYPPPSCDEATYASSADSFLSTGQFGLKVYTQGDPFGRDQNMVHIGRLHILGEALLFKLLGIKWEVARFYAFLGLVVAIWLTFELGRQLYSINIGVTAALLLAASAKSFFTGQQGRPDIWAAAAILLALIALWQMLHKPAHWRRAILAGLLGVVQFDFHVNGLWFLAGGCVLILIECVIIRRDWIKVLGYAGGVSLGGGLWLAAHLLPDPVSAWYQLTVGYKLLGNSPAAHGLLYNLQLTWSWLQDSFGFAFGPLGILELALAGIGLVWASLHLGSANRFMVVVLLVSIFGFSAGMSQKFPQYAFLWLPFVYLLGAAALGQWLAPQHFTLGPVTLSGALVFTASIVAVASLNFAGGLWLGYGYSNSQADRLNAQLIAGVPPGSRVSASQVWWWALRDRNTFISDEYVSLPFVYLNPLETQPTQQVVDKTVSALKPDFIVLGHALACYAYPDERWQALQKYAEQTCKPIATLRSPQADDGQWVTYLRYTNTVYQCSPE